MSRGTPLNDTLFARLLFDVMVPAELAQAIRAQGYAVAEARALPLDMQQDDRALLEEAARQRRVLVTCNYSDPQSTFVSFMKSGKHRAKNTRVSFSFRSSKSVTDCSGST